MSTGALVVAFLFQPQSNNFHPSGNCIWRRFKLVFRILVQLLQPSLISHWWWQLSHGRPRSRRGLCGTGHSKDVYCREIWRMGDEHKGTHIDGDTRCILLQLQLRLTWTHEEWHKETHGEGDLGIFTFISAKWFICKFLCTPEPQIYLHLHWALCTLQRHFCDLIVFHARTTGTSVCLRRQSAKNWDYPKGFCPRYRLRIVCNW